MTRPSCIDLHFYCQNLVIFLKKKNTACISADFHLDSNSTQLIIAASLFCGTIPLLNNVKYLIVLTLQLWELYASWCGFILFVRFCLASFWLQKKCFTSPLSAAAFCLHVVQIWLPMVSKDISWNGHCIFWYSDVIEFSICCFYRPVYYATCLNSHTGHFLEQKWMYIKYCSVNK